MASDPLPDAELVDANPSTGVGLGEVWGRLSARRWLIAGGLASGAVLGVLVLVLVPAQFSSSSSLLPEKDSGGLNVNLGVLSQFSGLLGGSNPANMLNQGESIPPDLYPEIMESLPIQLALLAQTVEPRSAERQPLHQFLAREVLDIDPILSLPLNAALSDTSLIRLTREQEQLVRELGSRITASLNVRTGVLTVTALMPDPNVSAQTTAAAVSLLAGFAESYRLQKLRRNLTFVEERYQEARSAFDEASTTLAQFRDQNRNIAREVARVQLDRLQAEFDVAFNVYNGLSTKLEEAKIQVQEQTPVFQTLQPVSVPRRRSFPPVILTIVFCSLLGLLLGAGWAYLRPELDELRGRRLAQ